jgi:ABC-type thiamin/hydroxymethylpyrimidine transport system permease subunit
MSPAPLTHRPAFWLLAYVLLIVLFVLVLWSRAPLPAAVLAGICVGVASTALDRSVREYRERQQP